MTPLTFRRCGDRLRVDVALPDAAGTLVETLVLDPASAWALYDQIADAMADLPIPYAPADGPDDASEG